MFYLASDKTAFFFITTITSDPNVPMTRIIAKLRKDGVHNIQFKFYVVWILFNPKLSLVFDTFIYRFV